MLAAPMRQLHVCVVGLGTAGAAAATLLARAGHRVQVLERVARPTSTVGAGIGIQPIGQSVLQTLGAFDAVASQGAIVDRLYGKTLGGRPVLDLRYADVDPRLYGIGLHRGVLFSELTALAAAEPLVSIRTGVDATDVRVDAGRGTFVTVTAAAEATERHDALALGATGSASDTASGDRLANGDSLGPFDLCIVADGTHSAIRPRLRSRGMWSAERPYPWGCLWTNLPDPEGAFAHTLEQVYDGCGLMLGVLPIGKAPGLRNRGVGGRGAGSFAVRSSDARPRSGDGGDAGSGGAGSGGGGSGGGGSGGGGGDEAREGTNAVTLFWSLRNDSVGRVREAGIGHWVDRWSALMPKLAPLLQGLAMEDLLHATYSDVTMRNLGKGQVVCLGDCAHATSPQLGQGANLALVDAYALSQVLEAHFPTPVDGPAARSSASDGGGGGGDDGATVAARVSSALEDYSRQRRWRTWWHQLNSRVLTPVFQSDSRVIGGLRDALMGPACRFPPTRHQMAATMAGIASVEPLRYVTHGGLIPEHEYTAHLREGTGAMHTVAARAREGGR